MKEAQGTRTVLEIDDLHVSYRSSGGKVDAVKGVSMSVAAGEALGIVGESGSGKSTVLRAVLGMLRRNAQLENGRILIDGTDVVGNPAALARTRGHSVTMIFQDPANSLNPSLTIGRQLGRLLRLERPGLSRRERQAEIARSLERVGVDATNKLSSYPFEFSQGQLQRIVIAASCLIRSPLLLLADEPTTSLDVTIEAEVIALLTELRRELSMAVVFVTHDLALVAEFCDRALVLYQGEVVEEGDVPTLLEAPSHSYTRQLLAAVPEFPGVGLSVASGVPGGTDFTSEGAGR